MTKYNVRPLVARQLEFTTQVPPKMVPGANTP